MAEFRMPSLGADMDAGTLVQWLVKAGDRVTRGDSIAVVETQKGAIEIESFETGTVAELRLAEGSSVPVGTVLAHIEPGSADAPRSPPAPPPAPPVPPVPPVAASPVAAPQVAAPQVAAPQVAAPQVVALPVAAPPPVAAPDRDASSSAVPAPTPPPDGHPWPPGHTWVRSSLSARARARVLGVDLATVKGTGPHGAVTRADVERVAGGAPSVVAPVAPPPAAPPPAAPPPAARPGPASTPGQAMRAAIAAAMARSNREIPHYHLAHSVDLHHALNVLAAFNTQRPAEERVLPAALLLHAIGRVLPRHPELNGRWSDQGFVPAPGVHVGVAVSLRGGGLVVPALHDADRLDLAEVMAGLRDLVARARAGRLRSSDLADGTITVTNLGDQGVELVHGVIYPGQAALIGIGRVVERPWAVSGMLAVRPVVQLSLAGDHRASDGHRGAQFLAAVDRFLQEIQLP